MKALLLNLGALAGLLLCVAGIVGLLVTGLDLLYGSLSLLVAVSGGLVVAWCGGQIRRVSRAEAEGAPGRRSRQKPTDGPRAIDKGRRL